MLSRILGQNLASSLPVAVKTESFAPRLKLDELVYSIFLKQPFPSLTEQSFSQDVT